MEDHILLGQAFHNMGVWRLLLFISSMFKRACCMRFWVPISQNIIIKCYSVVWMYGRYAKISFWQQRAQDKLSTSRARMCCWYQVNPKESFLNAATHHLWTKYPVLFMQVNLLCSAAANTLKQNGCHSVRILSQDIGWQCTRRVLTSLT